MPQSNGGVATTSRVTLYPMFNAITGTVGFFSFDPNNGYDDPIAGSVYAFKIEDVIQGRTPTISRVIVTYRDMGRVTATFAVTGTTDSQQVVGGPMQTVQMGNLVPTGTLMTIVVGLSLTAQNLQLTVTRAAGAGPLSIAKIVICGRCEDQTYG